MNRSFRKTESQIRTSRNSDRLREKSCRTKSQGILSKSAYKTEYQWQERKQDLAKEKAEKCVHRPGILKKIKAEISHQISQEVAVQIREHLPVSLKEQVAESNKQVEELTASLKNS